MRSDGGGGGPGGLPVWPPLGVAALRRVYREGSTSPEAVIATVLDRIERRGNDHVWIWRSPAEAVHARAVELARLRERDGGLDRLPLFGIPFAVKDNVDVAGLPTTAACPDFTRVATRTAPVVDRLLRAGAVLVGKTNLDQFATGLAGVRSPYGVPESVYGRRLIAGGSSSGSALAVAAGLVAFALGTDTAGSGRVPAAMNGIAGVKPTRGLLSTLGVVPACRSLDCVSVFAADVADAAEVAAMAAGVEPDDPWGRRPPPGAATLPPAAVTLGVPRMADLEFADAGLRDRFAAAVARAGGHVARCVPIDVAPLLQAGDLLYTGPWVAERLADLGAFLRANPRSVLPVTREVLERGWRFTAVDAFRAQHRLQSLRAAVDRQWDTVDALLMPTVGAVYTIEDLAADPVGRNLELGRYTHFANLLDLAAVTVPDGGTAAGAPASISVLGPAFSDPTLALLGAALASAPAPRPAPAPDAGSAHAAR